MLKRHHKQARSTYYRERASHVAQKQRIESEPDKTPTVVRLRPKPVLSPNPGSELDKPLFQSTPKPEERTSTGDDKKSDPGLNQPQAKPEQDTSMTLDENKTTPSISRRHSYNLRSPRKLTNPITLFARQLNESNQADSSSQLRTEQKGTPKLKSILKKTRQVWRTPSQATTPEVNVTPEKDPTVGNEVREADQQTVRLPAQQAPQRPIRDRKKPERLIENM